MMNSNLLSRFRSPSDPTAASIYETIQQHEDESLELNVEGSDSPEDDNRRSGQSVSVYQDLGRPERQLETSHGAVGYPSVYTSTKHGKRDTSRPKRRTSRNKWGSMRHGLVDVEEADDDVPASLLIEGPEDSPQVIDQPPPRSHSGPSRAQRAQAQWDRAQAEQDLHPLQPLSAANRTLPFATVAGVDQKEKALWRWANVQNLDNFLGDVYTYFLGQGFWSIILRRVLNLVTSAFVVGFSLFITRCVDYRRVSESSQMSEILVPRCAANMGFFSNLILWLTTFLWILKAFQYTVDVRRLSHLHDFYHYLLEVPEAEIQSISWQEIVRRLMALRDANPNILAPTKSKARRFLGTQDKQRVDAHDVANRLMRKDNYMIAMINRDILDLTLPIPFLRNRQLFTRTLEWHINYCIIDFVFNQKGQIRKIFLKETERKALVEGLHRRFIFAGSASLLIAPFLIVFYTLQNFFQYFYEYQHNPAQISSRQYNLLAQWKFREFNELWHLFERRLKMSDPFASIYLNQFPKEKTVQAARFVNFICGALISVLGLATVFDKENFLKFEITPGRTTMFYLGVFGTVWAVSRGLLPDDNMVYDTSYSMQKIMDFTHYRPAHWEDRLHTVEVKTEFSQLYQMQAQVVAEEFLSMIFTPFVLWFSLPKCSERIVDFFREFTVHVDGLGYVCSFAEFNFQKPGQRVVAANAGGRNHDPGAATATAMDEYFAAKDNKLEQSYWGFMNDYAPGADVRYPYQNSNKRKPFSMPPPFPGLLSPTLQAGQDAHTIATTTGAAFMAGRANAAFSPRRAATRHSGTPKVGPREVASPFHSLLLDPHHLPTNTATVFGANPPQSQRPGTSGLPTVSTVTHARPPIRNNLDRSTRANEDKESMANTPDDTRSSHDPGLAATEAGQRSGGGELGSWKFGEDDNSLGESDEDDTEMMTGQGGGVLGFIRQFQNAQGEGPRGGGVGV